MSKTLTSALSSIGDDKLKFQLISNSLVKSVDKKKTKDTEVTFATSEANTTQIYNNSGKVGIVVWVEKSDWECELSK